MRRIPIALVVPAAAVLVTVAATAQQEAPSAPATVKGVMVTMTVPASDVIFDAASEPPKDHQQWVAVRTSALMLAESGKLLMTGERAKDGTTWMEMARALVDQAEATLKAAEARNGDALSKAGDDVYLTCETCHARYMDK
jgi:cytochrome c556